MQSSHGELTQWKKRRAEDARVGRFVLANSWHPNQYHASRGRSLHPLPARDTLGSRAEGSQRKERSFSDKIVLLVEQLATRQARLCSTAHNQLRGHVGSKYSSLPSRKCENASKSGPRLIELIVRFRRRTRFATRGHLRSDAE